MGSFKDSFKGPFEGIYSIIGIPPNMGYNYGYPTGTFRK